MSKKINNNANASTPRLPEVEPQADQPAVVSPLVQRHGAIRVNSPENIRAAARNANAAARGQANANTARRQENAAGQANANAARRQANANTARRQANANAAAIGQENKETYGGKRKRSIRKTIRKTRRTLRNKNKRTRKH